MRLSALRPFVLVAALWAALAPTGTSVAHAAPDPAAELVADVLEQLPRGISRAWIEEHVDPGPSGWTDTALAAWADLLDAEGPLAKAVSAGADVVHVEPGSKGPLVVVDTSPPLAVQLAQLDDTLEIASIRATSCTDCAPRVRWARDLGLAVRHGVSLGDRLRPGLELDITAHLAANRALVGQKWSAFLDLYLHHDHAVAAAVGGAHVRGVRGEVVDVRYPDGRVDTWRIVPDPTMGWRLDYASLAPDSPLRLDGAEARRWRRDSTVRRVRADTWEAHGALADGLGRRLGEGATGLGVDVRDDTVIIAAIDLDQTLAGTFRVDPVDGAVTGRVDLPIHRQRVLLDGRPWHVRWPASLHPRADRFAVTTPDGVRVVDLTEGESRSAGAWPAEVTALGWRGDEVVVALADRRLVAGADVVPLPSRGAPVAVHAVGDRFEVVTDAGEVVVAGDAPRIHAEVCDGDAVAAARRPSDGTWAVLCGPTARAHHALIAVAEASPPRRVGDRGVAGGAIDWHPDGHHLVAPTVDGVMGLWRRADGDVVATFSTEPLHALAFSADGDHLAGLDPHGRVGWWSLPEIRQAAHEEAE